MKIVKTRDSATSALRKLGINSRDYNLFIKKISDTSFEVDVDKAKTHVAKPAEPVVIRDAGHNIPLARTAAVEKVVGKTRVRRVSVSARARELILAGKTNTEVWSALKVEFKLTDDRKHYPSWYRSQLRRTGLLPKRVK